jgi:N-acetylmuramic acid 6-phosphate etherase
MKKITEQSSDYQHLENQSVAELLHSINQEDSKVPAAVELIIPEIEAFVNACTARMKQGGRLFYLGAGTSGRLGIVDASECPPTFGVPHGLVVGLIAGGDAAIRKAVEFAEDDREQGWNDLMEHNICAQDTLVGIAASGTTPYVLGALEKANQMGVLTGGITCNPGSPLSTLAQYPMVPVVGPEFVTGNMISTSIMIQLGRVKGNKMVDMQLSNEKLVDRAIRMVCEEIPVTREAAKALLEQHTSVRASVEAYHKSNPSV